MKIGLCSTRLGTKFTRFSWAKYWGVEVLKSQSVNWTSTLCSSLKCVFHSNTSCKMYFHAHVSCVIKWQKCQFWQKSAGEWEWTLGPPSALSSSWRQDFPMTLSPSTYRHSLTSELWSELRSELKFELRSTERFYQPAFLWQITMFLFRQQPRDASEWAGCGRHHGGHARGHSTQWPQETAQEQASNCVFAFYFYIMG